MNWATGRGISKNPFRSLSPCGLYNLGLSLSWRPSPSAWAQGGSYACAWTQGQGTVCQEIRARPGKTSPGKALLRKLPYYELKRKLGRQLKGISGLPKPAQLFQRNSLGETAHEFGRKFGFTVFLFLYSKCHFRYKCDQLHLKILKQVMVCGPWRRYSKPLPPNPGGTAGPARSIRLGLL